MADDEMMASIGELIFSLVVGYLGALELAFVARHLYHWTCQHPSAAVDASADETELPRMRERLENELTDARALEETTGMNAMQDGVLYSNGFRVDPKQLNHMSGGGDKREALAAELERQKRIEEETRKQLAEAEAKLAEERRKAAEAVAAEAEAAENSRRLLEAEKQREAEQREREEVEKKRREAEQREREDTERKLQEAERQREAEQKEREENERVRREAEKQRELELQEHEENERKKREAQAKREAEQKELEENERKLAAAEQERLEAEHQRELIKAETKENERKLFEAMIEKQLYQQKDAEEEQARRDAEIVERLLAAERERKLSATESELEEEQLMAEQARRLLDSKAQLELKQKLIDENARIFLEAEEEMVALQQRKLQAEQDDEYAGLTPVVEEPCIKKIVTRKFDGPLEDEPVIEEPLVVHKVKTQIGQTSSREEPYMIKSKTLTFPSVSDEGSSHEPNSSQQSSFSTQPSEELTAEALRVHLETERQEPDGEDNVPEMQYTEDYLRSLDGIKSRPLIREDGSGRRRAFKKRRSSGSSNSSRDSRTSREDEVKMFTSLEEEELRRGDKEDYNPIKYTSEPTLRVKSHHRRHKRSPAKETKAQSTDANTSLEMLGEENINPWGEMTPEHYKDTEFWKREKAVSIDEEELELEKHASGEEVVEPELALPINVPKASSFEEATELQNKEAATVLQQQRSVEEAEKDSTEKSKSADSSSSDNKSNTCS